ncbi:MAG: TIGR02234 family membrane protein [Corynebacterium camporealensis]|uniref:TIGR02234 family membrane protein n=1 Tax=Corynebacterium camporealensis TaxID=161896 RepID=UPI002A915889|nr:TIGR02234 family membrane protein [Corynebacterium camporealensis]MDY5839129.1 TIGR02234 family membrane protein [Corynebacterium camporealensis]
MGRKIGPLLFAVAALLAWFATRMSWVSVVANDDKSGMTEVEITGSMWALELTAVALLFLAGAVAGLALRKTGRRIVGVVCAVAAAAAAWRPLTLITGGADPMRAQELLQGAQANENAVDSASISQWAVVNTADANVTGPLVAILASALVIFGGVLLVMRPGEDKKKQASRYETPAARQEKLSEDLETTPDSGRVMWDALDVDIDPTDLPEEDTSGPKARPASES